MFTFNTGIPAAGNNPSNDQPIMQANNVADAGIWNVDHVGFNQNNGGRHLQVTFNSKNTPGVQTDPISTLYTANGSVSSVAELFYKNQNATFPISAIRAWALCTPAGIVGSSNVASVARTIGQPAGVFTVTLATGAVSNSSMGILVSMQSTSTTVGPPLRASIWQYIITGTGTFDLYFQTTGGTNIDPINFSFQVLQI